MANDIVPQLNKSITWDQQQAREQVNALYAAVQDKVQSTVEWYVRKKRNPSRLSYVLRTMAILFTVLGGICPILQSALPDKILGPVSLNNLGYVLLAFAGGAVLIDKYGGYSTAWMRYINTHLKLDAKLHQFQIEWMIACAQYDLDPAKEPAKLVALMDKLRIFGIEASELVEQETQAWMVEFQNQLALLQKASEKEQKTITERGGTGDGKPATAGGAGVGAGPATISVKSNADGGGTPIVNPTPAKPAENPASTGDGTP